MSLPPPTPDQIAATDPRQSNWVTANAGSGKTHVLTQRVARLLLANVPPERILCLTYTKAAASEMQTRLFRMLGAWTMAPAEELASELSALSGDAPTALSPEARATARRLFARALETPGGLKIQTIHAFCDSLLRRFPLEAAVSPGFEIAEDRTARDLYSRVRSALGDAAESGADPALDLVAARLNDEAIGGLTFAILSKRAAFVEDPTEAMQAHFGHASQLSEVEVARRCLSVLNAVNYAAFAEVLLDKGGHHDRPVGEELVRYRNEPDAAPGDAVDRLIGKILTAKFEPRNPRGFPVKAVKQAWPSAEDDLRDLTRWAEDTRAAILSTRTAARTSDLHAFAHSFLTCYASSKAAQGLLDYDDLIGRSRSMLVEGAMREWILYKLDRGIEHILVDEAQDTSPQQWDVIRAISEDFLSGDSALQTNRSIFVVGDEKQSIYSFQGAEPQAFGRMRDWYGQRFRDVGSALGRPALTTSFRSAPAILTFVDHVFQGDAATGLTVDDTPVEHRAHRTGARGRVDLWPLIEPPEAPEEIAWWEPVDAVPQSDAKEQLARTVAQQISKMVGNDTLPARANRPARHVNAGDILVLVSKRDRLARGIIRELKALAVPVAGADRLSLTTELVVQDLLAYARAAVTPEDDLSLAALLRSPVGDVSEEDLYALAHGRKGSLRQALRNSDTHSTFAMELHDLTKRADFLRPFEFFEQALIGRGWRRKFVARLGVEAGDAIDEFLNQALAFEADHVPTLTGFIAWIEAAGIQIKREMESGKDEVRVMTIHGAKGLEAPIVILPDTMSSVGGRRSPIALAETGGNTPDLMLWLGRRDEDDPVARAARDAEHRRQRDERRRLLYVALTRAEDWLILCGANARGTVEDNWYDLLSAGIARCPDTQILPSPTGEGEMLRFETGTPVEVVAVGSTPEPRADEDVPAWMIPAPVEARLLRPRPSDLTPRDAGQSDIEESTESFPGTGLGRSLAIQRGLAIHALLEHPGDGCLEPPVFDRIVRPFLPNAAPEILDGVRAEVASVLDMPEANRLFGPHSIAEMSVSIDHPHGGPRMIGRIDRIIAEDGVVEVIDVKSDSAPPQEIRSIPAKYLAQLGAYLSSVRTAWPGYEVRLTLLWTRSASLMHVDPADAEHAYLTANWESRDYQTT
ncbi:MAG: double-strand break repair helicase AddA [Pseudomonadota bacterium]